VLYLEEHEEHVVPAIRRQQVTHDSDADRMQVIDRILYKLDELVRPFVHKILVVIEPLLIDEDYYARVEGAAPSLISKSLRPVCEL